MINKNSFLYIYRWSIAFVIALTAFMFYHDFTGGRMFTFSGQQQWNSSGPGYHK